MSEEHERCTAVHEAAHAVVNYRAAGHAGGRISIVPHDDILGHADDYVSDSGSSEDMAGRILSCYAGGHAQRRFDPTIDDIGCDIDDDIALKELRAWGWEAREQEFRDRSRVLVEQHWTEILAVADELIRCRTLDETEIEIIADIAAGVPEVTAADLELYRAMRPSSRA